MFSYRIKMREAFKDGNVLEGRFLKSGEILIVNADEKFRIAQSGGNFEELETLVPNPLKKFEEAIQVVVHDEPVTVNSIKPEEVPVITELGQENKLELKAKRKGGRPKKVQS